MTTDNVTVNAPFLTQTDTSRIKEVRNDITNSLERIQKEDSIENLLLSKNNTNPIKTENNIHHMYGYKYSTEELLSSLEKAGYKIVPFEYTHSDFGGYRNQSILNLSEERVVAEETTIKTFCAIKKVGEIASFENIFYNVANSVFGPRSIDDYKPKLTL